jgi:hypothetical protein
MLVNRYGVSRSTAYTDINQTYDLYLKTGKLRRDVELYFLSQSAKVMERNAFESKNISLQIKAVEARTRVLSLIKEDDPIDWSKIQPSNFYFVMNQVVNNKTAILKIDADRVHELPKDELAIIKNNIEENFSEKTLKILEDYNGSDSAPG